MGKIFVHSGKFYTFAGNFFLNATHNILIKEYTSMSYRLPLLASLWLILTTLSPSPLYAKAPFPHTPQEEHGQVPPVHTWPAGTEIPENWVKTVGVEQCFLSANIPDSIWNRMQGMSYRVNPHVQHRHLRYLRLLHRDMEGRIFLGEMVCNLSIEKDLREIFLALYLENYPIERMRLPEVFQANDERQMKANNSSSFLFRQVNGTKTLSKHALGKAVDLNPLYNPFVRRRTDGTYEVQPKGAEGYRDREKEFPYKITNDDTACRLFKAHGFRWGGDWKTRKDYQHFEK